MKKPLSPKLAGGSIGANISVVFLWLLNTYVQINPPGEVKASIAGLFAAAGVWAARSE